MTTARGVNIGVAAQEALYGNHPPLNFKGHGDCKGTTRFGRPCGGPAKPNGYCSHHQGQAPKG